MSASISVYTKLGACDDLLMTNTAAAETTAADIHIMKAESPTQYRREERNGHLEGAMINLTVSRDSYSGYSATRSKKGFVVTWNVNRGGRMCSPWCKGWNATFKTEAEAFAFADTKWPVLLAWLEKRAAELRAGRLIPSGERPRG